MTSLQKTLASRIAYSLILVSGVLSGTLLFWMYRFSQKPLPAVASPITPVNQPMQAIATGVAQSLLKPSPGSASTAPLEPAPDPILEPTSDQSWSSESPNATSQPIAAEPISKPVFVAPQEFRGKTIHRAMLKSSDRVIALTFDDGPWLESTPRVLEILRTNDVKATFFWVGRYLQAYPQIGRQVVTDGHAIGNHTWDHRYNQVNPETALEEIQNTGALISKVTGVRTFFFRPPGGYLKNGLVDYAQQNGYTVVLWSVVAADTQRHISSAAIIRNVLAGVRPGAIVLLHDGGGDRHATIEALPSLITELRNRGYTFVTIPELLHLQETEQAHTSQ